MVKQHVSFSVALHHTSDRERSKDLSLSGRLVYDWCQINQLSHCKMWKWIDSATLKRYHLNIPINHVAKYIYIDSIKSKEWLKWFNQISQSTRYIHTFMLTFLGKFPISLTFFGKRSISLTFLGKRSISLTFLGYFESQFNWFSHTSPSKSIDSVTHFVKTNWLSHQSTHLENELNRFNRFCEKMNRFKSIISSSWLVYKSARRSLEQWIITLLSSCAHMCCLQCRVGETVGNVSFGSVSCTDTPKGQQKWNPARAPYRSSDLVYRW